MTEPLDLDAIEAKVLGGQNYDPDTNWEGIVEDLIAEVKRLRAVNDGLCEELGYT